jgi:hypothetical protein
MISISVDNATEPQGFWVPEKLVEISIKKLETVKRDLEKNWAYQITSVGLSVGLLLGLGDAISKKLFDSSGYDNALFLILPLVNLYLFMRFGGLFSAFSKARFATEKIVTAFYQNAISEDLSIDRVPDMATFFETNSYFEYYHSREYTDFGVFAYF